MTDNTANSLRVKRKTISRKRISKACEHECRYTGGNASEATPTSTALSSASPETASLPAPPLPGVLTPQGSQKRYIARCSWLSEVFVSDEASASTSVNPQPSSSPELAAETEPALWLQSIPQSHYMKLISWFSEHCYIFVPVVEFEELKRLVDACTNLQSDEESSLLLAANCHASSLSIEAWRPELTLLYPSDMWRRCVDSLFRVCNPSYSLTYIKVLVLKATPSIAEGVTCPVASPISTLVRSSQLAGLHHEPTRLGITSDVEAEERRRLFWKVHELDACFSVAHGLPTLLHPSSHNVREIEAGSNPGLIFLKHRSRASMIFSDIVGNTMGHNGTSSKVYKDLTTAVTNFQETIRGLEHVWGPNPGVSIKAIGSAKEFIETFVLCANDFIFAPMKWITALYSVYQPAVIILRDLIQHPGSAESDDLGRIVATCFEAAADDGQYMWKKLRRLKSKAWELNGWSANTEISPGQDIEEITDWDTFFASFTNDNAFLDFAQF
ncbi:hypothetical protein PG989_008159 [Apiospora arundinis]|uniref:Xylanolytic transcriptional activator regulatory domain-containing protein n=1 Tax=Apiospora arundinis TaxID=335852 RepID=A0ABR2J647_9PEZI